MRAIRPSILARINSRELRIAYKLFRQWFPYAEGVRHAVAHSAELHRDAATSARNTFQGMALSAILHNRSFAHSLDGQLVQYQLDQTSLSRLNRVKEYFYQPFLNLDPVRIARDGAIRQVIRQVLGDSETPATGKTPDGD
jgi:hypothetical protein